MRPHFWIVLAATVVFLMVEQPWEAPRHYEKPARDLWARDALGLLRHLSLYLYAIAVVFAHAVCGYRGRGEGKTPQVTPRQE